jgi:alpha-1,3-rhamnosyltransferase
MQNPLVSVLIPAYNHQKYVKETIISIINQTYQNIELLLIDDGSKDSTWNQICLMEQLCKERFVNISFETRNNCGICLTLNRLIDKAQGKYVYLIASDDLAKPQSIALQVNFLENNPNYVQVMGDNEIIDENSKRVFWDKKRNNINDESKAVYKTFASYLKQERPDINFNSDSFGSYESLIKGGNYIPNGNLFLRTALLEVGKYNENAPLDDLYINLQIAQRYKIKFIDEVLFSYRWHSSNSIKKIMSSLSQQTIYYELFYAPKNEKTKAFINRFDLYEKKNFFFFAIEKYRSQLQRKKYLVFGKKKFLIKCADIVFEHYAFEDEKK